MVVHLDICILLTTDESGEINFSSHKLIAILGFPDIEILVFCCLVKMKSVLNMPVLWNLSLKRPTLD